MINDSDSQSVDSWWGEPTIRNQSSTETGDGQKGGMKEHTSGAESSSNTRSPSGTPANGSEWDPTALPSRIPLQQQAAAHSAQRSSVASAPPSRINPLPDSKRIGFATVPRHTSPPVKSVWTESDANPAQNSSSPPRAAQPPTQSSSREGAEVRRSGGGGGSSGGRGGAGGGRGTGGGGSGSGGRGVLTSNGTAPAEAVPAAEPSKARRYLDRIEGLKATAPDNGAADMEGDDWDSDGRTPIVVSTGNIADDGPQHSKDHPGLLAAAKEGGKSGDIAARALPKASHTKVKTATFIKSSTALDQCPPPRFPEFAVIGRSNVGKSSLINSLTSQNGLAKTSKTPGESSRFYSFLVCDRDLGPGLPSAG